MNTIDQLLASADRYDAKMNAEPARPPTGYDYNYLREILDQIKAQLAPVESTGNQPPLRAVKMGLFPTLDSLQSVVDLGLSQLPIRTPNAVVSLLMTYHNTLLDQVASCKPVAYDFHGRPENDALKPFKGK